MAFDLWNGVVLFCIISSLQIGQNTVLCNDSWTVTTLEEPPYVTVDNSKSGNERFKGYVPDLLKKIAEKLNKKYTLSLVQDGKYGGKVGAGWNGMIGEVYNNKATLAAGPLTVSSERAAVVDFSVHFMNFSTVILLRKSAINASDPNSVKGYQELINQPDYKFGVVKDGSTEQLIRASKYPDLQNLQRKLDHVDSQEDGIEKVRNSKEKYAFIIEANTADYYVKKHCELTTLEIPATVLDQRHYAFALAKNSPLTTQINGAITQLRDSGELEKLKQKWWHNECDGTTQVMFSFSTVAALILVALLEATI